MPITKEKVVNAGYRLATNRIVNHLARDADRIDAGNPFNNTRILPDEKSKN